MWDAFTLLMGLRAIELSAREGAPVVPEPEFKPFVFRKRNSAASGIPAANSTQHPRTLEELGVPRAFAVELEATFRAMGAVHGDRIVGFTFRTPDGAAHELRPSAPRSGAATAGRAA
jgi:hypothetical protein